MNREWVTLAFGVLLVAAVAVVSVWHNYPGTPAEPNSAPVAPADIPAPAEQAEQSAAPAAPPVATPQKPAASTPQKPAAPTAQKPAAATPQAAPPIAAPTTPMRVDASVPVVHKHRFGDCEGTLRAVPGTLSYSTANEEDGFRVAFAEIEEFELGEQGKNLRVRRRGGRTWNFTTEGDSATALATFHKEASRARK